MDRVKMYYLEIIVRGSENIFRFVMENFFKQCIFKLELLQMIMNAEKYYR